MIDFKKYSFVFNAYAYFASREKYPDPDKTFMDLITEQSAEGFDAICWGLAETSRQGDARRRYYGYKDGEVLDEEWLKQHLRLGEVMTARLILVDAIRRGMGNEEDEDEEIDEVLLELQKKRKATD